MRVFYWFVLFFIVLTSCEIKGVESSAKDKEMEAIEGSTPNKEADKSGVDIKTPEKASDTLKLDNGIIITYFKKGRGDKLLKGDMIKIDYRAKLEDGTIYDGNHLVKKPSIPFLVGWNQQTPGWDLALKELRVGDDVDVFLPSRFARGEQGIKGIVPPNANNVISIRVLEMFEPTKVIDDIQFWKYDELKEPGDSIDFKDEVYINYWVSSESKPRYDYNYQRGESFKLVMGDGNIVPGLYKALHFAREGDRLMIKIPAKEAYGSKGLQDLVKPNEDIFYDIQIAKVIKHK
ncbi:MAG TPA: FKBP-type peptidyl-prolyl cis-trans isomerase [Brumimicrobium sp.]|nr:FKBP-type peptidyl-prolyl cis-trans isomerase [Brumimicrobium sp.]